MFFCSVDLIYSGSRMFRFTVCRGLNLAPFLKLCSCVQATCLCKITFPLAVRALCLPCRAFKISIASWCFRKSTISVNVSFSRSNRDFSWKKLLLVHLCFSLFYLCLTLPVWHYSCFFPVICILLNMLSTVYEMPICFCFNSFSVIFCLFLMYCYTFWN